MQTPPEIALRRVPGGDEVLRVVRHKIAALERFCRRIQSCRVIVETPHARRVSGNVYHVRLEVRVPGRDIVVRRDPPAHHAHEDVYVAIRDAFHSARRRLEDWVRERRGVTKVHPPGAHGRVLSVFPTEGFGFVQTPDGRQVYFHRNSLLRGEFGRLRPGTRVRFTEEEGVEGAQATSLRAVSRRHRHTG